MAELRRMMFHMGQDDWTALHEAVTDYMAFRRSMAADAADDETAEQDRRVISACRFFADQLGAKI